MSVCLQLEIEKLKAENDRLKLENQGSRMSTQASISASPPPHIHSQASGTGAGLSQHSLNLTTSESTSLGKARFTWCRDYTVSFYLFEISVDGQNNLLRQWINMLLSKYFLTIGFLHWLNFLKGKHGKTCLCTSVSLTFFTVFLSDMLLDDTGREGGLRKEGRHVKMVVSLEEDSKWGEVRPVWKTHTKGYYYCTCWLFGI